MANELNNQPYKLMNVQTFKLVTGDEIIGDVGLIDDNFINVEHAVVLQMMQDPATQKIVRAFGDWPALAAPGQIIRVPITAVLTMPVAAHEELERQYTANVTGLDLPPVTPKILLS